MDLNAQTYRLSHRTYVVFPLQVSLCVRVSKVVAECGHLENLKYSRTLPYAFTEHGAIMVASVFNTPRAIEVSVFIVRAFIKLRQLIAGHRELQRKISKIEKRLTDHDKQIVELVNLIKQLLNPKPPPMKRKRGF